MTGEAVPLDAIAALFLSVSLLAFGGVNAVLPEIHHQAVEIERWLTDREFTDLYALTQAAPGPNYLIVSLIGYRAAGIGGAIVATVATAGPPAILTYYVAKVWDRFQGAAWQGAIQTALAPLTAGLVGASAAVLLRAADTTAPRIAVTAVLVFIASFTSVNPLLVFAAAAVFGMLGFV